MQEQESVGTGEQLAVGSRLSQERGCDHTPNRREASDKLNLGRAPALERAVERVRQGCYQAGGRIRVSMMEELVCSNKNSNFIMSRLCLCQKRMTSSW